MANERDTPGFAALHIGIVVDNADPEKLGRVRVKVPGLIEPASAWAHPLGWPGAGSKQRGWFDPPPKGAHVGVLFNQGDVDHPYYLGGYPGRGEAPSELADASAEDAADRIKVLETERWKLVFDSRKGKERLRLFDKKVDGDAAVDWDGKELTLRIKATAQVIIESDGMVKIAAPAIQLGDRVVVPNGKPIS